MPTVSLEDVQPGAVLARPIEDSMGRVLINTGEKLTEQLIKVLQKRGFVEVDIRQPEQASASAELTKRVTKSYVTDVDRDPEVIELKKSIEARFHNFPDREANLNMHMIQLVAQNVLVRRLLKKRDI